MSHRADAAVAAVPLALVPALGAVQGGYLPDTWVWATPIAAWAAAVAALFGAGALRRTWPWAAAALALLAWTGASSLWSAHASQSILETRRTALYAAVVLALAALARRGAASALVAGTYTGVVALLGYALGRYLLGTPHYDPFEGRLLAQPLGYANAVGILSVLGLLLGAGIAAGAQRTAVRAAAAAPLPLLALALSLTSSRASWLALVAGAVVALALGGTRAVALPLVVAAPGSAVLVALAVALGLTDQQAHPPRRDDVLVAVAALLVAGATAAVAARAGRLGDGRGLSRRLVLALLLAAAVAAIAGAAATGTTEPRSSYWRVAWHAQIVPHPLAGTGAGTFGFYWARSGLPLRFGGALDAHSLYLETLAELGVVGLLLLLVLLALPLRGLLRRRAGAFAPAAASAYVAFLVHAGLDWDWELPAVGIAALACGAALLLGDDEPPQPPPALLRAAAVAAALALGAIGLAGASSHTVPAARDLPSRRERAPQREALSSRRPV